MGISEQTYSTTVFVTMILIPGLVGLLLVLTADARLGYSSQLSTVCTETKECLLYDRICENENYEVRYYSSLKWVSTDASGLLMGVPTIEAFMRLFRYITTSRDPDKETCLWNLQGTERFCLIDLLSQGTSMYNYRID